MLGIGGGLGKGVKGKGSKGIRHNGGNFRVYIFDTLTINRLLHIQINPKPDVYFKFMFYS